MVCEKCGGTCKIDMINTSVNHTSFIRTLTRIFMIFFTCGLWILVPKRKEKIKSKKIAICQECGNIRRL